MLFIAQEVFTVKVICSLVDGTLKMFADDSEEADGSNIVVGGSANPESCKLGMQLTPFTFTWHLNNFAKIRDGSGLRFLKTTGITCRSVVFVMSNLLTCLETS